MAKKSKKSKAKQSKLKSLKQSTSDRRIPKIAAVMLTLLAVYLAIAFVSYLYTWQADQDQVFDFSWSLLFDQALQVENWLGRFGAVVSNAFFYRGVGLPAFIIVFVTLKLAYLLFSERSLWGILPPVQYALTFIIYMSPLLAFVFSGSGFPWGGALGDFLTAWLSEFVGTVGTALLFLFLGFAFLVWNFHHISTKSTFSFRIPKFSWSKFWQTSAVDISGEQPTIADESWSTPEEIEAQKKTSSAPANDAVTNKDSLEFEIPAAEPKSQKPMEQKNAELEINDFQPIKEVKDEEPPPLTVPTNEPPKIRETPELIVEKENTVHLEPYDPTSELSRYERPRQSLLRDYEDEGFQINREELEQNKDQIINTLRHYKIEIEKIRATIGPTVTLYEIVPAPGVRISKIKNLEDDIALSLAALGIRIIAPIPGKGTIGIEVPNKTKQTVGLKELLSTEKFKHAKMDLPIALGKTISNEVFIGDLAKMPHLLIAGATGQGKSVGINTILMSILYKKHPSQVKLVLIDPKKVELFPYSKLANHFLAFLPNQDEPIITETNRVVYTLNSLCIEMDQRYDLLKKAHARNIKEYNKKFIARNLNPQNGHRFMPFIVLVIDEFADLIMTAGKEVELPIARLAQLARAVGIHLIIATQRPSVNIITGVIKANFPARLAFRVTSKVDSRTILDAGGADQLIGRGDMLLTHGSDMIRLQCAFVDTPEVEDVIDSIAAQKGYAVPFFLPEYTGDEDEGKMVGGINLKELDEMFEDAALLVIHNQQGSTSMIQRKLRLGYNRAGRIMDQLEAIGVVGPNEGSKAREVLMTSEMELHHQMDALRQL
ncbi:MAG: DNA translocase FtsK [Saprospiraceae bacterium]|nr:DNA translocase FtsK [Saprospiraceae bacterium]